MPPSLFTRHPENPIITPGIHPWRMAATFNPGVVYHDGLYYLYERTAPSLRPFFCFIGLLTSRDGIHFTHASDQPVFTPAMAGSPYGSVQDPRVVHLDGRFLMTYAFRPFTWSIHPTAVGIPEGFETRFPGFNGDTTANQTRSGITASADGLHWEHLAWVSPPEVDDRDVILFPERIQGKYVCLRRPRRRVDPMVAMPDRACIWLSWSDDLLSWSEPELLLEPEQPWEGNRIGGSTPPIRTDAGWLVFYHGVETLDPVLRRVCYRLGAMLLDLDNPQRVIARCPHFLMEPEAYYERCGAVIPNVIFPTGVVLRDSMICLYYGVCDTAIALATAILDAVLETVLKS